MTAGAHIAALRSHKISQMLQGHKHSLEDVRQGLAKFGTDGYDIWFHAASLGEFEQARPLIERILDNNPKAAILLTFFSPSGYNVRKDFNPRVQVAYLPFDNKGNVRRFLNVAHPQKAIFVKYEFWGNYLSELKRRKIPTYIISALFRPKQIFFRPWGGIFRKMLTCYTRLFVQDEASRELLSRIGITNVTVAGDTRFDRVAEISSKAGRCAEVEDFLETADAPGSTIVFGSSWPSDECAYISYLHERTDVKAIIAPHEFDCKRIKELRQSLGGNETVVLSELRAGSKPSRQSRFLIIDCFGLLSTIYRYADIAYVGGGFGMGIHNINEAAAFSVPVVFGPNCEKFKEATDLLDRGGAFMATQHQQVSVILEELVKDSSKRERAGKTAGEYIVASKGATSKILGIIFPQTE